MNTLPNDLRYAWRRLRKNPGFTLMAALTLALGIGANTAIFSVVNAVLLRPLPYEHAERLVRLLRTNAKRGTTAQSHSFPNFADLRAQQGVFDMLAAYHEVDGTLIWNDQPERIDGLGVSADLFTMLGTQAQLGRTFLPDDEQLGGAPFVIISHSMWQRRFASDPQIIGKNIRLNSKSRAIIGVLPASFQFPFVNDPPEYFTPLDPKGEIETQRGANYLRVIGRLKESVVLERADAEMRAIAARLEQQYPEDDANQSVRVVFAHEELVGGLRRTLYVLLGAVGFVLLIACANVANLQLAHAAGRGRETAIRVALGASRGRVIRGLLTESLLLSALGGALGLLFASWGGDLLSAFVPEDIPRLKETGLDRVVLGFTMLASMLTGIIFGLAPALQASKIDLNESLKESGRSASDGRRSHRVRSLLIVSEVALSLVLLVGAGLLIKSFLHLRSIKPGFNAERVLTASVSLPGAKYVKDEQVVSFYEQLTARVAQLPGVEAVGGILGMPFGDNFVGTTFTVAGRPDPGPGAQPTATTSIVTPDYFRALGIPVIKGRVFTERDTVDAPKVLLINEMLARQFFPNEDPLGKYLDLGLNDIHGVIVGVVGDVRQRRLSDEIAPAYYVPHAQVPFNSMSIVVRAKTDDPLSLAASLRAAVQELDKELPLFEVQAMTSLVADSIARQRFSMTLLAAFAGIALALAAVGIFSIMSFLVTQRTHEIGIRIALGAQASDVFKLVVGQGMILALIGVAIGVAASLSLTHLMATLLYEVSATDPTIFMAIPALLIVVASLACYLPARRAVKVDPMVALRYE